MNSPTYAIAYLRNVRFGDDIIDYLKQIDATLAEYAGRFIVHGGRLTPVEGEWDGDVVVIEFPSHEAGVQWYESAAYQAILPLRTGNADSIVTFVEGVQAGYRATDSVATLLEQHDAGLTPR